MFAKIKYLMPSIMWAAFILIASLLPASSFPKVNIVDFDKVVHAGIYFVLIFFLWLYFHKKRNISPELFLILCTGCIIFGITIEILQHTLTKTRHFDWYDVIANTFGVVLFASVRKVVARFF